MKFFKPIDFKVGGRENLIAVVDACDIANARLELEGKTVYQWYEENNSCWSDVITDTGKKKALLINIEPIQKCKHPLSNQVKERFSGDLLTQVLCRCGQWLKVTTTFEEIK